MKKGKIIMTITIGLMCFILFAVIFMQFKTINSTDITALERMRESELEKEIMTLKAKYEETYKKLTETTDKISEYKETINSEQKALQVLQDEVKESQVLLGKSDVSGTGVIVTLSDTKNANIESEDLLVLINLLNDAGAEAISINDQRVVCNSYIATIRNTFIRMDGEVITSPYTVKAIGNSQYLESAISQKNVGFVDEKLSEGKFVEVKQVENINIGKYTGDLKFEYVKEEE